MNINSPLEQLIGSSLDALRRARTEGEREKVDAAVGGFRSGGLGVIGPEDTLEALVKGQVDELLISSQLRSLQPVGAHAASTAADSLGAVLPEPVLEPIAAGEPAEADAEMVRLADELVTRATQTSAKITFIEHADLLADYGGVAAHSEVHDLKVAAPCRFGRRVLRTTAMPEITVPTIARTISVPTMTSKTVDCIQVRMRRP